MERLLYLVFALQHAWCAFSPCFVYLSLCAWMFFFMVSLVLIYSLMHSLNSANTVYAHTAHDSPMKHIFVFMWLCNINAAKYIWIKTYTVFVYILLKCFWNLPYTVLSWSFSYMVEVKLARSVMWKCSQKVNRMNNVSCRNKCRNYQRCLILGGIVYASVLLQ